MKHITSVKEKSHRRSTRHKRKTTRPKPTATPTATATATPAYSLTAEDSVAPVTCNGPAKPLATHPFLTPPYHGWTSMVTYFDHDSPNFVQDGLMIATTGAQATPDAEHHRTDFPGYWNAKIRQYLDYDGHNGYDYDLSYRAVYAAAAGTVIFAAPEYPDALDHGYGNMVMIDHHNGYVTLYGHFSRLLVKTGQKVHRAQRIGISGNTGHSTGPHLHFTVFHNCNPTDPYGWFGSGPDPLQSYQGETSVQLWTHAPLITNPLPDWPGLGTLPAMSAQERILVTMPSTRNGTGPFERSLRSRIKAVRVTLKREGITGRADILRGAVLLQAPVTPLQLYRLPYIASIEALDSVDGSKAQVLASLASAAARTSHRSQGLKLAHSWTGHLISWAGRTLLVGTGTRGREVALRIPGKGRTSTIERVRADARNGTYAIDLGRLSATAYSNLLKGLRSHTGTKSLVHTLPGSMRQPVQRSTVPAGSHASNDTWLVVPIILCALCVGIAAVHLKGPARPAGTD